MKCAACQDQVDPAIVREGMCLNCLAAALRRCRAERAGTLYHVAQLFADVSKALTGTIEPLTDDQLLAQAKECGDARKEHWKCEAVRGPEDD